MVFFCIETDFACAFSALIHDVDHTGVSNPRVIVENPELGRKYRERSVAEQNSVDLSWDLLQESRFGDLRKAIYGEDPAAQSRFRQLVVNCVMVRVVRYCKQDMFSLPETSNRLLISWTRTSRRCVTIVGRWLSTS